MHVARNSPLRSAQIRILRTSYVRETLGETTKVDRRDRNG